VGKDSFAGDDAGGYYQVLRVDPSASMVEIRRSYLKLARAAHPDFHTESDAARVTAEERMRKINEAWAVLGDVDERSAYDRGRLSGRVRPPFHGASHGPADEPDPWKPFDRGPDAGFDDRDDRPITTSSLPSWLKTLPALGVMFGLAALMVGSLVNIPGVARIGMFALIFSVVLFAVAPLVALSLSKGQDTRP
jgi:DnaJ domain